MGEQARKCPVCGCALQLVDFEINTNGPSYGSHVTLGIRASTAWKCEGGCSFRVESAGITAREADRIYHLAATIEAREKARAGLAKVDKLRATLDELSRQAESVAKELREATKP